MIKKIDENFFKQYTQEKLPYNEIYQHYSRVNEAVELFKTPNAPRLRKVCVLGAATGLVQKDFYQAFKIIPYGCEINEWAFEQIEIKFRKRTKLMDMRDYLYFCLEKKLFFTLVFSNSLQYLDKKEIPHFLKMLSEICLYIHFHGSFKGDSARDPYRATLETYAWWNQQFRRCGFREVLDTWGNRTYMWKTKHAHILCQT